MPMSAHNTMDNNAISKIARVKTAKDKIAMASNP